MAKTMAYLTGNVVSNMVWCSDSQRETDTLKNPGDRPVAIGDTWEAGRFYRDGVEVLTPYEEAINRIAELEAVNADQAAALTAIYDGTTEVSV